MKAQLRKQRSRQRRKMSVRSGIRRNSDRPRLSIHRSTKHIFAQVIDDVAGKTVVAFGTDAKAFNADHGSKSKTDCAKLVGEEIAKRALAAGVEQVVFDRGDARYHGRVRALAESAREAGLKF